MLRVCQALGHKGEQGTLPASVELSLMEEKSTMNRLAVSAGTGAELVGCDREVKTWGLCTEGQRGAGQLERCEVGPGLGEAATRRSRAGSRWEAEGVAKRGGCPARRGGAQLGAHLIRETQGPPPYRTAAGPPKELPLSV